MHMTYETEGQLGKDKLSTMLAQHATQAHNVGEKIKEIIDLNKEKVEERIRQRKLKAYSSKTKSEKTFQPPLERTPQHKIEVIVEEEEDRQKDQLKAKGDAKRWRSLQPKGSERDGAVPEPEKVRRRSTIVELHCRFTMDG